MIACIGRAIDEKIPLLDMKYLENISADDFERITQGNVKIPLFEQRLNILRAVAGIVNREFLGDFSNCVKLCKGDGM